MRRTPRDDDRRTAAPAPGPACRGPRPCRSQPSRARRRSRETSRRRQLRFDETDRFVDRREHGVIGRPRSFSIAAGSSSGSSLGPSPLSKRTVRPSACGTTRMSENKIAASNPNRRIGCSVTSAASFGAKHISSMLPTVLRIAMYSGRYRPAWRIIQTGGTAWRLPSSTSRSGLCTDSPVGHPSPLNTKFLIVVTLTPWIRLTLAHPQPATLRPAIPVVRTLSCG